MKRHLTLLSYGVLFIGVSAVCQAQHVSVFTQADTPKVTIDLAGKKVIRSGTFRVDGNYSVFVTGFNRLRQHVTVTVAGRDVFREPLGPFKAPEDTAKAEEAAGGSTDFLSINGIDDAITDLELLRDRGLRVLDEAYSLTSPVDADYVALRGSIQRLQADLDKVASLNQGFTSVPTTSVAYRSVIRQIFVRVRMLDASEAKTELLAKEADYEALSERIATGLELIQSKSLHFLSFGPFQASNDVITVNLKVREVDRKGGISDVETPLAHEVRVNDGFKIDFSAGLLYTSLEDKTYRAVAQGTDPETYRVTGFKQGGTIQTATFVHFRGILGGSQNYGLTLGMALEERPYYAFGVSLHSSSSRQRLVLTGGIALRSVTRYEGSRNINTTEFQTVSKMKSAAFFAISYNF